jgi:hypothetical protein
MKVKVTKPFPWAPDGNHVRNVKAGEVLEGRGAEVALQLNSGEKLATEPEKAQPPAQSQQEPQKGKGR